MGDLIISLFGTLTNESTDFLLITNWIITKFFSCIYICRRFGVGVIRCQEGSDGDKLEEEMKRSFSDEVGEG